MEGLIPLVYKSIKRSMSAGPSVKLGSHQSYNVADFYPDGYNYVYPKQQGEGRGGGREVALQSKYRQRHKSFSYAQNADTSYSPKQLVRFRSNRFLSCITGAGVGA